jgi:tRNA pseudouridine65 synthase
MAHSPDYPENPPPRQDWHLDIVFRDEWLVAVNKPPGMLVHRTRISRDRDFVLQRLRNQLGRRVYPVHRLDRATSGLLLFALDPETDSITSTDFQEGRVTKHYLAVVRGWTDEAGTIEHALKTEDRTRLREATTHYRRLDKVELAEPVGPHPTARYSLVAFRPETGRTHQIRRHANHFAHPIIGDTTHGDGRNNRLFRRRFGIHRLLLHAWTLDLSHPRTGEPLRLQAPLPPDFQHILENLGWQLPDEPVEL